MKRKITLGIATIASSIAPISAVVACNNGGGSTIKHIISTETQRLIMDKLNALNDPLGELVSGKGFDIVSEQKVKEAIASVTKNVILDEILLFEKDKATGKETETGTLQKVLPNHTYRIVYLLAPINDSKWEGQSVGTSPLRFNGQSKDSETSDLSLNESQFKGLTFKNLDEVLKNRGTLEDLLVDETGKSWANSVDIWVSYFEATELDADNWYYVENTATVTPGLKIKAIITVVPKGKYGWDSGDDRFEPRVLHTDPIIATVQWKNDIHDFFMRYSHVSGKRQITLNLHPGFYHGKDEQEFGESYVEFYMRTTQDQSTNKPNTYNDYVKQSYDGPIAFNPDPDKDYMSYVQALNLPSDKRYVNFKLVYKNFFSSALEYPYLMYDRDFIEKQLPFDNAAEFTQIVKDGADLIVYTYSIPYWL